MPKKVIIMLSTNPAHKTPHPTLQIREFRVFEISSFVCRNLAATSARVAEFGSGGEFLDELMVTIVN
jgi:hypothetical protein